MSWHFFHFFFFCNIKAIFIGEFFINSIFLGVETFHPFKNFYVRKSFKLSSRKKEFFDIHGEFFRFFRCGKFKTFFLLLWKQISLFNLAMEFSHHFYTKIWLCRRKNLITRCCCGTTAWNKCEKFCVIMPEIENFLLFKLLNWSCLVKLKNKLKSSSNVWFTPRCPDFMRLYLYKKFSDWLTTFLCELRILIGDATGKKIFWGSKFLAVSLNHKRTENIHEIEKLYVWIMKLIVNN